MNWRRKERPALTLKQLAIEGLLTKIQEMPVGSSLTLVDRAGDGFGGLVVKRHSKHTLVFQRAYSQERSRWADTTNQAREEIETYINTGKLKEPDRIKGW